MSRIDAHLFQEGHYLGKPADFNERIVTRRVAIVRNIPNFCGKNFDLADIGCGNGASSFLLAADMKTCTGIELFPEHQAAFEAYKSAHQVQNTSFQLHNIEARPLTRLYDRFISFEVIEHLQDDRHVKNYFESLRPGGLGAISVPHKWWIFETHGAKLPLLPWNRVPFFSWLPRPLHERYANARIYTRSRITHLLREAGFEIVSTQLVTAPMDVLPDGKLKTWLQRTFFNRDTTRNPFAATAVFVVVRRPE